MVNFVNLIDGRTVDSSSEEWRIECLARTIARMPHIHQRRQAMQNWQKKMPKQAFSDFSQLVAKIYNNEFSRKY